MNKHLINTLNKYSVKKIISRRLTWLKNNHIFDSTAVDFFVFLK